MERNGCDGKIISSNVQGRGGEGCVVQNVGPTGGGQVKREDEGQASSQKLTAGLTETFFGLRSFRSLSL